MNLISCNDCNNQVSANATKCPHCGARLRKPKRGIVGQISKWSFILFNVFMIYSFVVGIIGTGEVYNQAASEAEQAGAAIGTVLGMGMLLTFWVLGIIILGAFTYFTRARD